MNAREEQNICSLSACQNKTSSFGRGNDEYDEYESLGQLILFAVSLLQDDTSVTENVPGVCGHHSAIC